MEQFPRIRTDHFGDAPLAIEKRPQEAAAAEYAGTGRDNSFGQTLQRSALASRGADQTAPSGLSRRTRAGSPLSHPEETRPGRAWAPSTSPTTSSSIARSP